MLHLKFFPCTEINCISIVFYFLHARFYLSVQKQFSESFSNNYESLSQLLITFGVVSRRLRDTGATP